MEESRSVSSIITCIPLRKVSGSGSPPIRVSPQPRMAVRGVRSSWETEEMKSFFTFSELLSSSAMLLMEAHSSPISSSFSTSSRTPKSPWAICLAVWPTSPMGMTMELMK